MAKYQFIDADEYSQDPFAEKETAANEFESLLEAEKDLPFAKRFKVGESATGVVVSVGADFVFVDLGGKNAGSLACEEFLSAGLTLPKSGESLTAYVKLDNGSEILLTRSLKRGDVDDSLIRNAYESKIPVEAKVEKVNKGGFEVSIGTKHGFVPMSNMDLVRIENPDIYIGNVFQFHIIELRGKNIVLSRKSLLREELEVKKAKVLDVLEEGQLHKATITRIMNFGAFASIDGLEGLISLGELSGKRVKSASEVVKEGDVVTVRILKIERQPKLRVALSLKDGSESAQWDNYKDQNVSKHSPKDSSVSAEQTNIFASAFSKAKAKK